MNWREYISSDPQVLFGKPVINGTRVSVDLILEKLANDHSVSEILDAYPRLTKQAIQACLFFAADIAKHEKVLAVA